MPEIDHYVAQQSPDYIVIINAHGGASDGNSIDLPENVIVGSPWDAYEGDTTLSVLADPDADFLWHNLFILGDVPRWHFYEGDFPDKTITIEYGELDKVIWYSRNKKVHNRFARFFEDDISNMREIKEKQHCKLSDIIEEITNHENYDEESRIVILVCTCDTDSNDALRIRIDEDMSLQYLDGDGYRHGGNGNENGNGNGNGNGYENGNGNGNGNYRSRSNRKQKRTRKQLLN